MKNCGYVVKSAHFPVMCVIRHTLARVTSSDIGGHIVGSGHIPVMFVIRHSEIGMT